VLYPFKFHPIFKERVWGGRKLEELYGKPLPPGKPIGESWEISDRPGDISVIADGPLAGKNLHWLMEHHGRELLGPSAACGGRFPLLVKILDAREKLSLQVHPPAHKAAALGGEPKTEMWYIADALPGAELYVGLRRGITRAEFERKTKLGTVEDCFHRVPVKRGDVMFLPSGRVHAIGSGLVIFEIQQNSDTTYRVHDWNRLGLDGKPREMHVAQSLESIDFNDFEPSLVGHEHRTVGGVEVRLLVDDPLFRVDAVTAPEVRPGAMHLADPRCRIAGVAQGEVTLCSKAGELPLRCGEFCLIPYAAGPVEARFEPGSTVVLAQTSQ
jgi:mannose-6-phosphate isomerase